MSLAVQPTQRESARQRRFVSEVSHSLSQPLTALHCSLELSLACDQTVEEFRASVAAAMQNAERLRQRLLLCRELSEADDPGDILQPVPLHRVLQQLREELLPLAESAGCELELTCTPLHVRGSETRLTRGLFYLLEFLLRIVQENSDLRVRAQQVNEEEVEITISVGGLQPEILAGEELRSRCEIEIAQRTFRAVGGDLAVSAAAFMPSVWIVRLPLAD